MNPDDVLEELLEVITNGETLDIDHLDASTLSIGRCLPVWLLNAGATSLADARQTDYWHCLVSHRGDLVTYVRVRVGKDVDLREIGNMRAAVRFAASLQSLGDAPDLRLVVMPSRHLAAVWSPAEGSVSIALAVEQTHFMATPLSEDEFNDLLPESSVGSLGADVATWRLPITDHPRWLAPRLAA